MRIPSIINDAALELYILARELPGVTTIHLLASKHWNSDSRYLTINKGLGTAGKIRLSSHTSPPNYDLNLVIHNAEEQENAIKRARNWLLATYGPKVQTAA